ncbi:uncharacterized protein LOC106074424 [Biomphalaria glabrata]|uniref:Uncharacterized protein LOC106074424 n=1 Tax=Biomphalaria glabrata TaxID=6526 RepID=A0A9W2ZCH6_BIOGL|nr:uncharacterized protein LOC106074424 [Biomphalaria glabrata]
MFLSELSFSCFYVIEVLVQLSKVTADSDHADSVCGENIRIDNYCYLYSKHLMSWSSAKFFCQSNGMVLARTENLRLLSQRVRERNPRGSSGIWVGASDVDVEGKYVWIDSYTPVAAELWAPGFPNKNNSYLDCVHVDINFYIRNVRCTRKFEVLCQYSIIVRSTFDNDKYQCHCASGTCTNEGKCQNPNDLCEPEYFGPYCQFKNVEATIKGTAGVLQDNDDKTCLTSVKSPLEIKLDTQQPFSWLRVVMKEKGQLKSFELSYSTSKNLRVGSDKRTETCRDRTYIVQDDYKLDIRCQVDVFEIDSLYLTWRGNKTICSVYIYGGRNLAFKQKTSQSGSNSNASSLAVDGIIGGNSNCSRGDPGLKSQTWDLILPHPVVIFKFVLYRRKGRSGFNYMNGFILETLTINDEVVFTHSEDKRDQEPIVTIPSESRDPVQKVRFRLDKTTANSRYLEICELLVYGECSSPNYGLTCSEVCLPSCVKQECHYDGYCYVCPFGKTGRTCQDQLEEGEDDDSSDEEMAALLDTYTKLIIVSVLAGLVFVLLTAILCYVRQGRIKRELMQEALKKQSLASHGTQGEGKKTTSTRSLRKHKSSKARDKKKSGEEQPPSQTISGPATTAIHSKPSLKTDFSGTSVEPTTVTSSVTTQH